MKLEPGSVFASYEIRGVVGRGAMGVVYLGWDPKLDREVALKVVSEHLTDDPAFRDRFSREARAAARVDHPGVVTIYETGEEAGVPYIAMKHVSGTDLETVLAEQGRLDPSRAFRLLTPVADGLDAAHKVGVVHRDVKPANILVPNDGSTSVLVDFGIGRVTHGTRATQTGTWVGTVDYVAPEQIRGSDLDGRADQYSLACVLFEVISGGPPFPRDDPLQAMFAHANDEPPLVESGDYEVDERINAALQRALSKDPSARFPSCGELLRSVQGFSGGGTQLGFQGGAAGDLRGIRDAVASTQTDFNSPSPPKLGPRGTVVGASGQHGDRSSDETDGASPAIQTRGRFTRVLIGAGALALLAVIGGAVSLGTGVVGVPEPSQGSGDESSTLGQVSAAALEWTPSCDYAIETIRKLQVDLSVWNGIGPAALNKEAQVARVALNTCQSGAPSAVGISEAKKLVDEAHSMLPKKARWKTGTYRFTCYPWGAIFSSRDRAAISQDARDKCAAKGDAGGTVEAVSRAPAPVADRIVVGANEIGGSLYDLLSDDNALAS